MSENSSSGEEADDEGVESEIDSELDDKQLAIETMAEEMEQNITRQKEYAQTIDRKMAKYEVKRKQMIESQRQLKQDVSDDE